MVRHKANRVILFPIFYLAFMALLGIVVLAFLPRFRVNGSNVLLFMVGSIAGHAATAILIERMLRPGEILWGFPEGFAFPFVLIGALGAGVGLVAARTKLNKAAQTQADSQSKKANCRENPRRSGKAV